MESLLFSGAFWGGILVLAGILIVINGFFNLQIPTFRIILAVIFIIIGITILGGGLRFHRHVNENTILFETGTLTAHPGVDSGSYKDYTIVFGSGLVDLSNIIPERGVINIKVTTAFGRGVVVIKSDIPVRINASSAFGDVRLPDDTYVSFGHNIYESENLKKNSNYLSIDASAAFGSISIIRK
jgi:predicted membrane protein